MSQKNDKTARYSRIAESGKRGFAHIVYGRGMVIVLLLVVQQLLLFGFFFSFAQYLQYYVGAVLIFTAAVLIYVLNTKGNPSIKLSWCFVMALLPIFGVLLYTYIQLDMGHRVEKRVLQAAIKRSSPYVSDQAALMEQVRTEDKGLYNLASYLKNNGGYPIYQNTSVKYFPLGELKFEEMLLQMERAKKFIFLEYFAIGKGYMWERTLEVLERKAGQGVEVRVLYDGTCAVSSLPYDYPKELEKLGIQCKVFSPLHPLVSTHYNNRDHRKILVVDGYTAFTGGVNLKDRYINRETVYGHWKDTAVMVQGDAARSFTLMFLQMWNATEKEHVYEPYLLEPQTCNPSLPGYVIPYGDSPMDDENVGEMVYLDMLNRARDYVYIMTPYLILDNEMLTALKFAARRGVDIRLILPHIPDKKYAFALAKSHYQELTEAGVKIFEYTPGFIHAKVFVSDDIHAVVGTINLDYRSLYLHFECAAYLYRVPAIQDILADFVDNFSKCQQVTKESIQNEKFTTKLAGRLLKAAAPLM